MDENDIKCIIHDYIRDKLDIDIEITSEGYDEYQHERVKVTLYLDGKQISCDSDNVYS